MARFMASFACYLGVQGRIVLIVCSTGCLVMAILTVVLPVPAASNGALACLLLLYTFEGPIFPTLFAMTLRGCGRHTKLVSTGLTMAISGGAVWPSIAWAVQRSHDSTYALYIVIAGFGFICVILSVINLHPTLRDWVDRLSRAQRTECSEPQRADTPPVSSSEKGQRDSHVSAFGTGLEHIEYTNHDRRPDDEIRPTESAAIPILHE
jgi:hypothetical protein